MSLYLKPTPPHSGLTALFGGNDKTGEYYHLTPYQHAFVGPLSSGSTAVTATTFFSGTSELGGLISSMSGVLSVSPGLNTYTGGTITRPTLGMLGNVSFTSVTANILSGGSIFSAGTDLSHLLGGVPTYVQPGLNITTGGTPSNPIVSVLGSPSFTAVTAQSVSATTFSSGGTELSVALSNLFNSMYEPIGANNTFVQPGTNIVTGGTPFRPTVSLANTITVQDINVDHLQVVNFVEFDSSMVIRNAMYLYAATLVFSSNTELQFLDIPTKRVLHTVPSSVPSFSKVVGNDQFTYDPDVDLLSVGNLSASTIMFSDTITDNSINEPNGIYYKADNGVVTANSGFCFSDTGGLMFLGTFSANTFFSGSSELGGLLAQTYAPISVVPTYVQPGLNITTGGTASRPIVNLSGSISLTGISASSVFGASVSATTFSSGTTELSVALSNKFNSAYAPITVQNQWVQPGNNIATGGTQNAPSVHLVSSPSVLHLLSSGVTYAQTISGNTMALRGAEYMSFTTVSASGALQDGDRVLVNTAAAAYTITETVGAGITRVLTFACASGSEIDFIPMNSVDGIPTTLKVIGPSTVTLLNIDGAGKWITISN